MPSATAAPAGLDLSDDFRPMLAGGMVAMLFLLLILMVALISAPVKAIEAETVAREIDVHTVLMGTLDSFGENIRISVELVDGQSNRVLWGDTFTLVRSGASEMEKRLSQEITDALVRFYHLQPTADLTVSTALSSVGLPSGR